VTRAGGTGLLIALLVGGAGGAGADPPVARAGLNLRSELGTHPLRLDLALATGRLELAAVLDPMFWTDGQNDIDLLASWQANRIWGLFGGLRSTSLGIQGGRQWHEKLVLGVSAPLGRAGPTGFLLRWGGELSTLLVKHSGGLPAETISFASGRDFIDLVNIGMFVRVLYARELGGGH
jgi:hypothetical protein